MIYKVGYIDIGNDFFRLAHFQTLTINSLIVAYMLF